VKCIEGGSWSFPAVISKSFVKKQSWRENPRLTVFQRICLDTSRHVRS
jgi:hypothetical protein